MKVLVTGGSGNVGVFVVDRLLARHEVTVADARAPEPFPDVDFVQVDLTDGAAVRQRVRGFDAVVHLAAIPNPFNDPGERVLSVNTTATYNVLEAMRANGVPRIVYLGSESESGFGLHHVEHRPQYFPIDEDHPCWPHESYSLSKYFCEIMCREYSRAYRLESVTLRPACVWLDVIEDDIQESIHGDVGKTNPKNWFGGYIYPEDVAQAIELALSYELPDAAVPFDNFYITAEDSSARQDSVPYVAKLFPEATPPIRDPEYYEKNPQASLFDITKAREKLGFRPAYTWRDWGSEKRVKPGARGA
jgi:UDP-glucose 4-epimerase